MYVIFRNFILFQDEINILLTSKFCSLQITVVPFRGSSLMKEVQMKNSTNSLLALLLFFLE